MFRIDVELPDVTLHGLKALDTRRALGLPDGSFLRIKPQRSRWVDVEESFARRYFCFDDSAEYTATTVLSHLGPGDLMDGPKGVKWSDSISDDRLKWLFDTAPDETTGSAE